MSKLLASEGAVQPHTMARPSLLGAGVAYLARPKDIPAHSQPFKLSIMSPKHQIRCNTDPLLGLQSLAAQQSLLREQGKIAQEKPSRRERLKHEYLTGPALARPAEIESTASRTARLQAHQF